MKIILIILSFVLTLSVILFNSSCSSAPMANYESSGYDTSTINYNNQIFRSTTKLDISMSTNGTYKPSFSWQSTGLKYIIIGIFTNRISVRDNKIQNPEDMIWTWNTGMARGREGDIIYIDGRDVANKVISSNNSTPLSLDKTYYCAMWAYDIDYNLIRSSKEFLYTVTTNIVQ